MNRCYSIALGANLGAARETFVAARLAFVKHQNADPCSLKSGGLYKTDPIGCPLDSPPFYNSAIQITMDAEPHDVLRFAKEVESKLGRTRPSVINAPRVIDIDMLLADDLIFQNNGLSLPHPRMHKRAFVLCPLADINPDLEIPEQGTVKKNLASLSTSGVHLITDSW